MLKMKKLMASLMAATLLLSGASLVKLQAEESESKNSEASQAEETQQGTQAQASEEDSAFNPDGLNVAMLKGPTAMGAAKLMVDQKALGTERAFNIRLATAPDEIVPLVVKGDLDLAAVPANLAATLYNKTKGQVEVLAINTLGVLYIVGQGEDVTSMADLKGKTLYASGRGATPEYVLRYLLSQNGLDPEKDLTIEWKSEHAECVAAMAQDESAYALLPQPFVTVAQTKNDKIKTMIDLNKAWEESNQGEHASGLVTGVLIGRKEVLEQKAEAVQEFLSAYEASMKLTEEDVDQAAELIGQVGIVPTPVAKKALPLCNIHYITGAEMKDRLSGYLKVLAEQDPKAIGGQLPADDFYYQVETNESQVSESEASESEVTEETKQAA